MTDPIVRVHELPEAAELLGVSVSTVRRYVDAGRIAAMKWGGRLRIEHTELVDFLARERAEANRERSARARATRKRAA
jgi:excisionase family DNA binding protein